MLSGRGVLLTLIAWIAVSDAQDLMIQPAMDSVTRPLKGAIIITCSATGISPDVNPFLKWYDKEDNEITERMGRRYIENDGDQNLKLYITSIENEDSGTYTCRGDIDGNTLEKTITLKIFKDITFDHAPSPQHPAIYTDDLIECEVSGQPSPTVSWRFKNDRIVSGGRYMVGQKGLTIMNISRDLDDGEYLCIGEVPADGRYAQTPILVEVHIPPVVTVGPGPEEGIAGEEVTITCEASGLPPPQYDFFKDGIPVSNTDRVQVDHDAGAVHFRPANEGDEGSYKCTASNDVGQSSLSGDLTILVRPKVHTLLNVTAVEGNSVTLVCESYGKPHPTMTFRKEGNNFDFEEGDNEGGRIKLVTTKPGQLEMTVENLSPSDTANYTCRSVNTAGEDLRNGTILVHYAPRFDKDHPNEFYLWSGKTRNITCMTQAEPVPAIEWLHYGVTLVQNETYRIYRMGKNSNLQITCLEEDQGWIYGTYTCSADNGLGGNQQDIEVLRATVPDTPKSVTVKDASPTMVVLSVVPPDDNGGVPIFGYRLEYEVVTQDFLLDETIKVENLRAGTQYIFRIRAKNEVGVGPALEHSHKTEAIRAPYPIVITSDREGEYSHEFRLEWERPRTGGLPIVEYEFKYREVRELVSGDLESVTDWTRQLRDDDQQRPMVAYTLKGLRESTDYQAEIRARNDIGWSLPNPEYVFFTKAGDVPNAQLQKGSLGTGAVIGIVIVVFLIFLVIVDISCYFMNRCGVLMCICVNCCGKQPNAAAKEKAMEEGDSKEVKQPPPVEEEAKVVPAEDQQLMAAPEKDEDKPEADDEEDDEKKPLSEGDPEELEPEDKEEARLEDPKEPQPQEDEKEVLKDEIEAEDADETTALTSETKEADPSQTERKEVDAAPPGEQVEQSATA